MLIILVNFNSDVNLTNLIKFLCKYRKKEIFFFYLILQRIKIKLKINRPHRYTVGL